MNFATFSSKVLKVFDFPDVGNYETQITLDYSFHYGYSYQNYIRPPKPAPVKVPTFRIAPPPPPQTTTTTESAPPTTTTTEPYTEPEIVTTISTLSPPQAINTPDFECGIVENEVTKSTPLIIGGRDVSRGQFPW